MSSGGFKVSLMKSHKKFEENSENIILERKISESQNNKNIETSGRKLKPVQYPSAYKPSAFETSTNLHQYARNLVMVQRYVFSTNVISVHLKTNRTKIHLFQIILYKFLCKTNVIPPKYVSLIIGSKYVTKYLSLSIQNDRKSRLCFDINVPRK